MLKTLASVLPGVPSENRMFGSKANLASSATLMAMRSMVGGRGGVRGEVQIDGDVGVRGGGGRARDACGEEHELESEGSAHGITHRTMARVQDTIATRGSTRK